MILHTYESTQCGRTAAGPLTSSFMCVYYRLLLSLKRPLCTLHWGAAPDLIWHCPRLDLASESVVTYSACDCARFSPEKQLLISASHSPIVVGRLCNEHKRAVTLKHRRQQKQIRRNI